MLILTDAMEIIRTDFLTKSFGSTVAVDRISLCVHQGEIYGFLGLNGAGKTTLIRLLLGMIQPGHGSVNLFGQKITSDFVGWNNVGYLVETPSSYPNLSVFENLTVYCQLRQLKDTVWVEDIVDRLKLTKFKDVKAKNLSLGNQQRLGLAKALMHQPKLLILDEPINGLDPEGIVEVRELLKTLARQGVTIFLSSHILGEISKVANRIGIIHQGKLIKELTNQQLSKQLYKKVLINTCDNKSAGEQLKSAGYEVTINIQNELEITDSKVIEHPETVAQLLVEKGLPPQKLYLHTEDLEKYFLRIIRN